MSFQFSDIYETIIPLLHKYPLVGSKQQDYLDFVKVAELIKTKEHLTAEGLEKIKLIKVGWILEEKFPKYRAYRVANFVYSFLIFIIKKICFKFYYMLEILKTNIKYYLFFREDYYVNNQQETEKIWFLY